MYFIPNFASVLVIFYFVLVHFILNNVIKSQSFVYICLTLVKIHLVLMYVNSWYSQVQVLRELMLDGMTNIMTHAWRKQMIVPLVTIAAMDRI